MVGVWLLLICSLGETGWALPSQIYIPVTRADLNPRHLGHLLVNDTYKVAFCPIEKVMSTQFRQVVLAPSPFPSLPLPPHLTSSLRSCSIALEEIPCGSSILITK